MWFLLGRGAFPNGSSTGGTFPPMRPPGIWSTVFYNIPLSQCNLWDQNLANSPFKSANLEALGILGGYQNPADASALLKNLASTIIAQFPLPEQVEVLLGCLSLGLRLPGLGSPLCACLCKHSIALLFSAR